MTQVEQNLPPSLFSQLPVHFQPINELILPSEQALFSSGNSTKSRSDECIISNSQDAPTILENLQIDSNITCKDSVEQPSLSNITNLSNLTSQSCEANVPHQFKIPKQSTNDEIQPDMSSQPHPPRPLAFQGPLPTETLVNPDFPENHNILGGESQRSNPQKSNHESSAHVSPSNLIKGFKGFLATETTSQSECNSTKLKSGHQHDKRISFKKTMKVINNEKKIQRSTLKDFKLRMIQQKKMQPMDFIMITEKSQVNRSESSSSFQSLQNLKREYASRLKDSDLAPNQLTYKVTRTDNKIVPCILEHNGFVPAPSGSNFNIYWCGSHLRPYLFENLNVFQKINHFPKSFELTRKSNMYRKYLEMKSKFPNNYDYLPTTWILPRELDSLKQTLHKNHGNQLYIFKPASASSGRGIQLICNVQELQEAIQDHNISDEFVCSHYISNPLLVDGYKFDLRLYVAVTSYNPLRIYLYEDGLVRFAAEKYNLDPSKRTNKYMHLTNYSINKNNQNFVFNSDASNDGFGNKWSISALRTYFKHHNIDDVQLFRRIEDVIIKSILTVESDQRTALRNFVPHPHTNCFELFGFDILIDSQLKPWVMEINLSPSLSTDTPLDKKIKVGMLTDLLNMVQIHQYSTKVHKKLVNAKKKITILSLFQNENLDNSDYHLLKGLKGEERAVMIIAVREMQRRGSFKRIFPSSTSHHYHSQMVWNGLNVLLHERLNGNLLSSSSSRRVIGSEILGRRMTINADRPIKSSSQPTSPNFSSSRRRTTLFGKSSSMENSEPDSSQEVQNGSPLNLENLISSLKSIDSKYRLDDYSPQGAHQLPQVFQNHISRIHPKKTPGLPLKKQLSTLTLEFQ